MGEMFKQTQFVFNSTGEMVSNYKPFQLFSDSKGTILNKNHIEYGVYNKIIDIEFKKLLMIKKHIIGFGDVIDWITKKTKIKNLIMFVTNGNCGCEERKIFFNKWIKFYWFSIHFRKIYSEDKYVVKDQKILLKNLLPIQIGEPIKKKPHKTIKIQSPKIEPIITKTEKKSCGCNAKS